MARRGVWRTLLIGFVCITALNACKGSTGPPGLVPDGSVAGKVTVWEDAVANSRNAPALIPAGGFTVTLVGDSTRTATTSPDGSYSIPDVPAGTYIVVTSRDSASAIGYGTMKAYNFFVGGGASFHSTDIGRKAPKPNAVSASVDSVSDGNGGNIPVVKVGWSITPPTLQFTTFFYVFTFQSPTAGTATVTVLGSGALSDTLLVSGLGSGTFNVFVAADQGLGYFDETTGVTVFPTRSAPTAAPNSVTLTRPAPVDLTPEMLSRAFPDKRVAVAKRMKDE